MKSIQWMKRFGTNAVRILLFGGNVLSRGESGGGDEKKGYVNSYIQGNFGKISIRDLYNHTKDETEAIEFIKNNFKRV